MISYTDEKLEQSTDANLSFKNFYPNVNRNLLWRVTAWLDSDEKGKKRERVYETAAKRRTIGSLRDTSFKTDFPFFEISGLLS